MNSPTYRCVELSAAIYRARLTGVVQREAGLYDFFPTAVIQFCPIVCRFVLNVAIERRRLLLEVSENRSY